MKKKLLVLIVAALSSVTYVNAQITLPKTWEFTNVANWPTSSTYYATNKITQELNLIATDQTVATPVNPIMIDRTATPVNFGDGFTGTRAYRFNGSSQAADKTTLGTVNNLPTYRYLSFSVSGPFTIKIWFTSGAGSARILRVTDGSNTLSADMSSTSSTNPQIFTANANYTGTVYICCPNSITIGGGLDIFKIEVTTTALGTDTFKPETESIVYSNEKQVFVSNVKSSTVIEVYGMTGALVKSLKTEADTSFSLNSGIYIVKTKSPEGEKTTKILVE